MTPPKKAAQDNSATAQGALLRRQAEAKIAAQITEVGDQLSREEIRRLLHELQIHQVELEMQNEELRNAQVALLESRARYFDLYDLAPVGYLTLNDRDEILESNLALATMLRGPRHLLKRARFPRYIVTDDQDFFQLRRKRLVETGEMQPFELRMVRIDGSTFWARLDASLAFDEATNRPLCLLTIIDIDQAKQQAEAMKLNTIVVNAANDAIFTTTGTPDYLITSWNPGAEAIYGWSAADAIGQSARMLHSIYPGHEPEAVRRAILASGGYQGEVIQSTKAGATIHVDSHIVAHTDEQGNVVGWVCVNRDVTDQKRAEVTLRQAQRNLAHAQRIGHIGSWEWDLQRSTLFWSEELYRLFGVASDFPLTYASIEAMIHADDRAFNNAKVQELLASGEPTDFRFRIVRPDGAIRHIAQHIVAELDGAGAPACLVGIMQDITERTRAEAERTALHVRLAEAERLEMVGRLAGGIAHDFNNMLSTILLRSEIGLQITQPDDPNVRHLGEINKTARRSSGLVRQLLGFAGKQIISPRTLDLNATIEGLLTLVRELLGAEVDMLFQGAPGLWPVYIDPSQVDQILVNLCINAREAIGTAGRVIISTANVEAEHEVWATGFVISPGNYVVLSVTDNGRGMEHDELDHLFEPFFSTKPDGKGSGLGLATVYGIVKQNHGDIQVYSEPGIGSTFDIYLPRYRAGAEVETNTAQPALLRGQGETILLVEDREELLQSTAEALRQLGYSVMATTSPPEAQRLAAAGPARVDLLITDIVMPHMDGIELAARMTAQQPGIKCLYVSGYPAEFIANRGLLNTELHFLRKPFSLTTLATTVRAVLDG